MIYLELFWIFFRIGLFTIGGGYAMIPMITQEIVDEKGWLTDTQLLNYIGISESTPGPFAINIATYVGAETGGIGGALCATLGVVLPSFVCILIVARCFEAFRSSFVVQGCMTGLKPAVVGLIGASVLSVAATVFVPSGISAAVLTDPSFYASLVIFAVCALLAFKKAHPILVICLAAALGILAGYVL